MRYAEIVLGIILKVTGEPDDGKLSRPVRRGADGKVPLGNSPAAYPTGIRLDVWEDDGSDEFKQTLQRIDQQGPFMEK